MKKIGALILSTLLFFCLWGCRRVAVSKADELTMKGWTAHTKSGMSAELIFDGDFAKFCVSDSEGKLLSAIQGVYAVDNSKLYITDSHLCKTYTFSYDVFADKAELIYLGEKLTFYPLSVAETEPSKFEKTE